MTGRPRVSLALTALVVAAFSGWVVASSRAARQDAPEQREAVTTTPVQTVKRVLRGVLTFDRAEHQATIRLAEPVNVDKCVVTLSDAIVRGERDYPSPRSGAIVAELSENRLTVWTDDQRTQRAVSFQVIEYH